MAPYSGLVLKTAKCGNFPKSATHALIIPSRNIISLKTRNGSKAFCHFDQHGQKPKRVVLEKLSQYIKASAAAQSLVRQYIMRAPGQRRSSSVRKYATQSGRTEEVSLGLLLLHI